MTDNHGYVLAPLPVAPVNETDMVLLPKGLHALKQVAKEVGLDLRGAYVNLDGGFDSRANRKWHCQVVDHPPQPMTLYPSPYPLADRVNLKRDSRHDATR
jgi:hypothetical protein